MKKSEVWVEKKISAWRRNLEGLITQVCRSHSGAKVLFSSHTNPCMMKSISFWMHSSSSGRNSSDEEMFSAMHEMLMIFSVKTLTSQSSANYRAIITLPLQNRKWREKLNQSQRQKTHWTPGDNGPSPKKNANMIIDLLGCPPPPNTLTLVLFVCLCEKIKMEETAHWVVFMWPHSA